MSNCTDHEPYMMYRGTDPSIMLCHNAESLFEGCFPVPGGHALVQIVNDCQVSVVKGMRFLHDADAPVEVSGEAVLQIIRLYQRVAGEECLMADQHPLFKASPR